MNIILNKVIINNYLLEVYNKYGIEFKYRRGESYCSDPLSEVHRNFIDSMPISFLKAWVNNTIKSTSKFLDIYALARTYGHIYKCYEANLDKYEYKEFDLQQLLDDTQNFNLKGWAYSR